MTFAVSTSSRIVSVAFFSPQGELVWHGQREANMRASEAILALSAQSGIDWADVTMCAADLGPGSFTGVRVGIVAAKTIAWTNGCECVGASAFDLIDAERTVVFPSKKGEWFVRKVGELAIRTTALPEEPFMGFGPGIEPETLPLAERFGTLLPKLVRVSAAAFRPEYLIEPSISTPKDLLKMGDSLGGEIEVTWDAVVRNRPLRALTTLKAGGPADYFLTTRSSDELAAACKLGFDADMNCTVLGWGSNVLPSDAGVRGLVIHNLAREITFNNDEPGRLVADSGCDFQEIFLKTLQRGWRGLEFAVGIPGTLGGALVSNAGAYRSNISEFVTRVEVVENGVRSWQEPGWMGFRYRDSVLRDGQKPGATLLRVELKLPVGPQKPGYDEARDYQRQRIGKQPPMASAGSFFKNVINPALAQELPGLTDGMRKNGVVPAGFLIEACGLKGTRLGGAMIGRRHANFILNVGGATATEIRSLALFVSEAVHARFDVRLEEEVLYLGDWSNYEPLPMAQ